MPLITLDEQARQLEELNADLADAREALREAQEAGEEATALADSHSEELGRMQVPLLIASDCLVIASDGRLALGGARPHAGAHPDCP